VYIWFCDDNMVAIFEGSIGHSSPLGRLRVHNN